MNRIADRPPAQSIAPETAQSLLVFQYKPQNSLNSSENGNDASKLKYPERQPTKGFFETPQGLKLNCPIKSLERGNGHAFCVVPVANLQSSAGKRA